MIDGTGKTYGAHRQRMEQLRAELAKLEKEEAESRPPLADGQLWRHADGSILVARSADTRRICVPGDRAPDDLVEYLGTLEELVERPPVRPLPADDSPECVGWWCYVWDDEEDFESLYLVTAFLRGKEFPAVTWIAGFAHARPVFPATEEQKRRVGERRK